MNFEEFVDYVKDNILDYMPRSYADATVDVQLVTKNNGLKLHGLMIYTGKSNIVPTLYLDDLFKAYENGDALELVMLRIVESYVEAANRTDINPDFVMDFEKVKPRIVPHLVNLEANAGKLLEIPYKILNDLAVIFFIETNRDREGVLKVCITNELMEMYGVGVSELYDIAVKNLNTFSVPFFKGIREFVSQDLGTDVSRPEEEQMYIITNADRVNGSAQILNLKLMEQISARIGGDFYIIPSSIHEVLAMPVGIIDIENLEFMVHEVNSTQVPMEDRLSDSVYAFDSVNREIVFGRDLTSIEEREAALLDKMNNKRWDASM